MALETEVGDLNVQIDNLEHQIQTKDRVIDQLEQIGVELARKNDRELRNLSKDCAQAIQVGRKQLAIIGGLETELQRSKQECLQMNNLLDELRNIRLAKE